MRPGAFVSFVGAGPGDPELITLKALRRLRAADVVIHDRLVATELLAEARADAEVIDAGKTPGRASTGQGEINWLLVDRARRCGHVVRLKGGDPGVFGRLAEEIDAVRAAGVNFEVVPGVSAALAAAGRTAVSLTERGRTSMVVLATGTDRDGGVPQLDWSVLAHADATLVFYMPVRGLEAITASLTMMGRDEREPALVVERACMVDERVIPGRLGDIAARARAAGVQSPALLLIGPTMASASVPVSLRRVLATAEA
jgi:uroporphyrin-III C-methyltransferase